MTTMPASRYRIAPPESIATLFRDAVAGRDDALAGLRWQGFERFMDLGFPTQKVEAWKYTSVAKLARNDFALPPAVDLSAADIAPFLAGGGDAYRLVFVNGHLSEALSDRKALPSGVRVNALSAGLSETPDRLADGEAVRGFSALNAAFLQDGAVLQIEDGASLDAPLHLLFVAAGSGGPAMVNVRNLVELGAGARAQVIETHAALADSETFTNLVNVIRLGAGAELVHDRLQIGAPSTSFIGKTEFRLATKAVARQTLATLGGALTRNETEARLDDACELLLNGVFVPKGREHVDNTIRVVHAAPGSHSDQFYKGVIDDRAHGVFAGKIVVERPAQKTNAYQSNNNLLLSAECEIDTKPELEIYADDVRCSHGATAGELDERELFYLRSRGLDRETAESLLTYAFAGEVIERFADDDVRHQARREMFRWLPGGEALQELI